MSDWSHRSAFQDFQVELGDPQDNIIGKDPPMQSVIFNGTGRYEEAIQEADC